jgi:hypothetical protein
MALRARVCQSVPAISLDVFDLEDLVVGKLQFVGSRPVSIVSRRDRRLTSPATGDIGRVKWSR